MGRIHLFEIEDQKWFPGFLRNYMTDFLQFLSNKAKIYEPIVPILNEALNKSKQNTILDLGSGGGGGLLWLCDELTKNHPDLKIVLTDYYPNKQAFEYTKSQNNHFDYIEEPVDALTITQDLQGFRSLFLILHHFKPEAAKRILENAVETNAPIGVFEAQERSFLSLLAMFFSPITVLLTTPFIRPFSIGRIIFTYLIPIVPVCVWWDGMVSSLRTYSVKEMGDLINSIENNERFDWEINKVTSGPGVILYLIGIPKKL